MIAALTNGLSYIALKSAHLADLRVDCRLGGARRARRAASGTRVRSIPTLLLVAPFGRHSSDRLSLPCYFSWGAPWHRACAKICTGMANGARVTDVQSVLDAYSTLEVERNATPEQIHAAYRTLAYHYHPDRLPARSSATEREQATRRMARLNAAYSLIRDAPLEHLRSPEQLPGDWPAAQMQLDRVLQRARKRRLWQQAGVILAFAALSLLAALRLGPAIVRLGFARQTAGLVVVAIVAAAWLLRSRDPWSAIDTATELLRALIAR